MTLPDRATVQAEGRPQFQAALDAQGVDVRVVRPGEADIQTRALMVPATSNSRQGAEPGRPEIDSLPWKLFFRHDEDGVKKPGFHVVDLTGRILIPTVPTVDVADQGVVLMVVATALAARTRLETLVFMMPGAGLVKNPINGNDMPAPGTPLPVTVRLVATADSRIRDTVGADSAEVVLIGRWGSLTAPQNRPNGLGWGSQAPLILDGQPGTLTLKLAYPDADTAAETQFGSRFLAVWTAST